MIYFASIIILLRGLLVICVLLANLGFFGTVLRHRTLSTTVRYLALQNIAQTQYNKMDDPTRINTHHSRFAGRVAAGVEQPVVVKKNGVRHVSNPCCVDRKIHSRFSLPPDYTDLCCLHL
jgi:hypothetical protein